MLAVLRRMTKVGFLGGGEEVSLREVQLFRISLTVLAFFFFFWPIFSLLNTFNEALFVECPFLARCCKPQVGIREAWLSRGTPPKDPPGSSRHSASALSPLLLPFCPLGGTGGGAPRHRNGPGFLPSWSYCTEMEMTGEARRGHR